MAVLCSLRKSVVEQVEFRVYGQWFRSGEAQKTRMVARAPLEVTRIRCGPGSCWIANHKMEIIIIPLDGTLRITRVVITCPLSIAHVHARHISLQVALPIFSTRDATVTFLYAVGQHVNSLGVHGPGEGP